MKKLLGKLLIGISFYFANGQNNGSLSGRMIDSKTFLPISGAILSVQNTNLTQLSDKSGNFHFPSVPFGNFILKVTTNGYKDLYLPIAIKSLTNVDLGEIIIEQDVSAEQQFSLITLTDHDLGDDNSGSENTAGILQASKDIFQRASAYNFGQARFRIRGIDNKYAMVLVNGLAMNRFLDGRPQYSNWGGLNDATRNQDFVDGSKPSDNTFGGIGGVQSIATRASLYRRGSRMSFLGTNTTYDYRAMITYASGMQKNGWAFVVSGSRRWATEAYFEGTNYAATSVFSSIEKKINTNQSLNFTGIFAQNRRGKNSPNTQEVNDLMGFKYNSYWGYQAGEKRNSRIKQIAEPLFILSHYWKINSNTHLNTNTSYQFGKIGNSRIDFQKANNPDPNYYKQLPSYYTSFYSFVNSVPTYTPNFEKAAEAKANFLSNPQLNWEEIYRINNENLQNGSRYVLYEDRTDDKTFSCNSNVSSQLSDKIIIYAGANFTQSTSSNFKNLIDLLGGNFFNDINPFGLTEAQQQADLNNPKRTVTVGQKYGYRYLLRSVNFNAFTQFKFTYDRINFYLAQSFSTTRYERQGFYKNGSYPTNSLGKSKIISFDNFGFKAGLTFKLSGQQFIDLNSLYMSKAPSHRDVFSNARLSNAITEKIDNEIVRSVDASYIIRKPNLKLRLTTYYNEILNVAESSFYFADNVNQGEGAFISEIITDLHKQNVGIEIGAEYQITSTIKATAVAAFGKYTYANNPNLTIRTDDEPNEIFSGKSAIKGYLQPGMPQQAYSIGVEYRDPKYWWIELNINYLANNHLDIAPLLRTSKYLSESDDANFPFDQNLSNQFLKQEKFDGLPLINLVGGKTWLIKNKSIGLFALANNLLNITYKTGGFEQGRNASYSELYKDHSGPTRSFGPKYFYGNGRTFLLSLSLNF